MKSIHIVKAGHEVIDGRYILDGENKKDTILNYVVGFGRFAIENLGYIFTTAYLWNRDTMNMYGCPQNVRDAATRNKFFEYMRSQSRVMGAIGFVFMDKFNCYTARPPENWSKQEKIKFIKNELDVVRSKRKDKYDSSLGFLIESKKSVRLVSYLIKKDSNTESGLITTMESDTKAMAKDGDDINMIAYTNLNVEPIIL